MYDAFEAVRLVEKLPLKICALATWGELRARSVFAVSWKGNMIMGVY